MPVGTERSTATATAGENQRNQSETSPASDCADRFDDLLCKAPFRVAIRVAGNIVGGATIGVLLGYAARADAGGAIGTLIGAVAGFAYGCVELVSEWPELQLEQVFDRRVRESEAIARYVGHNVDADLINALTFAADRLKSTAADHRRTVMDRYTSGKSVNIERCNRKVASLYRRALSLYQRALSLSEDESMKRSLTTRVESLKCLI
jgi:hypothetical protein